MNSGTRLHLAVFPYDIPAVQAWLEDQAAKGEFLSEYTILPVFDRGEPKAVRYRLEPIIQKEKAPDQYRRELYEELGWQYVCTIRKSFHIWRCDDPETPELFTEAETEGGGLSLPAADGAQGLSHLGHPVGIYFGASGMDVLFRDLFAP